MVGVIGVVGTHVVLDVGLHIRGGVVVVVLRAHQRIRGGVADFDDVEPVLIVVIK